MQSVLKIGFVLAKKGGAFAGQRVLTIESLLMSGSGHQEFITVLLGHEHTENVSIKL